MNSQNRVIYNVIAQNVRSVLNIVLALYSTRIVLDALGEGDYGIYALVAGVVAMLSFVSNAMVVATQRFLSFNLGSGDTFQSRKVFSSSLFIHIVIGFVLLLLLLLTKQWIVADLVIPVDRIETTMLLFNLVSLNIVVTFLTSPFKALFISHENIVYISLFDVLDGVLKLVLAYLLYVVPFDRLLCYGDIMLFISCFNFVGLVAYALPHYTESCLIPKRKDIDWGMIRTMGGFVGWSLYSTGCFVGRTQGLAYVLNHFFGTLINTAYGIAMQVSGAIQFVAQSIVNAMMPRIVKAEGAGEREKMLLLSLSASKFTFLLLAMAVIPVVAEMPQILQTWLGKEPEYTVLFCRFILIASLVDQLTIGLGLANQAIGRIRNYSICINTIKLLTLPFVALVFHFGTDAGYVECAMWVYVSIEMLCMLIRIPFLYYTANLSPVLVASRIFARVLLPALTMVLVCCGCLYLPAFPLRFVVVFVANALVSLPMIWYCSLEQSERELLQYIVFSKLKK